MNLVARRIVTRWLPAAAAVVVVAVVVVGFSTSRAATESPDYEVLERDGDFEIRQYSDLVLAVAPMPERERMNGAFGKLFRYISGDNSESEKIAMTTPVLMGTGGEDMAFILPRSHRDAPPDPEGDAAITTLPGGRFAVLRFASDGRTPDDDRNAVRDLRHRLAEKDITTSGEPIVAYYDPPWIPSFLRRHEVWLRISE